ncbi:hypothetical protein RCO28_06880 [Streptomyces sp. LHD-70]|nr:hypothetical protein [Streptomyces sp. LHD-70]MDQ8702217.1 hypothetical protein [Streptomyces sp. LHD-70]
MRGTGSRLGTTIWQCGTYVRMLSETPMEQRPFLTANIQVDG